MKCRSYRGVYSVNENKKNVTANFKQLFILMYNIVKYLRKSKKRVVIKKTHKNVIRKFPRK